MFGDLKYAWRSLAKSPEYAAITVLTLALGIGANTAVFSVVQGVLLKPLPYAHADRLYRIFLTGPAFPKFPLNPNDFLDYRSRNRVFESMASFTENDVQISDPDRPERLTALSVSKDYFHVLGFRPALGQDFVAANELKGNEHAVVLSDTLWRRRFNADPAIVGRKMVLNEAPFTIIGVMPTGFQHAGGDYRSPGHGSTVDAWLPFTFPTDRRARGSHYLNGIARLKDGITFEQAASDLNRIAADLGKEYPDSNRQWHVMLTSVYQEIVGKSERMLLVLLGAVGFVLLIACVNAANLLLARATARNREMAVRAALGASRRRIMGQILSESCLVALIAGVLGSLIAFWGVRALVSLAPQDFPRAFNIRVDAGVFGFTFLTALLTGILFGLAPALQASRTDLNDALRDGGRGSTTGARHLNLRSGLVIVEVGLASVLMIGAGLLLRSFVNILQTDPGFRPEKVLTATVSLPGARYKDRKAVARFYTALLDRIGSLPGVKVAGASTDLPWTGYDENSGFNVEGRSPEENDRVHARYHVATPDFFRSMGIPLLRGRFPTPSDNADAPGVILINNACARRYWPGADAVGKRITFSDKPADKDWMTVVGIVGDVKDTPTSAAAEPAFWWPHEQQPFGEMILTIRTDRDPLTVAGGVRRELGAMDKDLALGGLKTMDAVAGGAVSTTRFILFLMGLFSVIALSLAAIGMYGVMSYSVARRTHEFGVRMALGAGKRDLLGMVTAQGLKLVFIGIGCGVVLALGVARVLNSLVYGVGVRDAATFVVVSLVAAVVGLVACYVPARRATKADPMTALRYE
jgi:predicted permease